MYNEINELMNIKLFMIYIISFVVAFIGGFVVGLVNKNFINMATSGSAILHKHMYALYTAEDYEKLGGFRSRFLAISLFLLSVGIVGFLLYDLVLLKPFINNFSDIGFYIKVLGFVIGIYYGAKIITGTVRQKMNIQDKDIR